MCVRAHKRALSLYNKQFTQRAHIYTERRN